MDRHHREAQEYTIAVDTIPGHRTRRPAQDPRPEQDGKCQQRREPDDSGLHQRFQVLVVRRGKVFAEAHRSFGARIECCAS